MNFSVRSFVLPRLYFCFLTPKKIVLVLAASFASVAVTYAQSVYATPYAFSTFAGISSRGTTDGVGSVSRFAGPEGIAMDGAGNVFVADTKNHTIRKITPEGIVSTFAGSPGNGGAADGVAGTARFGGPRGVALDISGNLYVADTLNSTIRKITPAGVVTTIAGQARSIGNLDGIGSSARFSDPRGIAVDGLGNLFVADYNNSSIRKITPAGAVTTVAGGNGNGSLDGTGDVAQFYFPAGVAVDQSGNIYVADSLNQTVRKISAAGVVSTLAGLPGSVDSTDGHGSAARFYYPTGVALDNQGYIYIADSSNHRIRKITSGGDVTTIGGSSPIPGWADGASSAAQFFFPDALTVDGSGTVYVADTGNNTIRKIAAGQVSTFAGAANNMGAIDGVGGAAKFWDPYGIACDASGNLFIADSGNSLVRKISPAGIVTTFAGSAGNTGSDDGVGGAARFSGLRGVAVDFQGNVYVADTNNYVIRKITPAGAVTTLAGAAGQYGFVDGSGGAARFDLPYGIAVDLAGNVYVADTYNHAIRKITPMGVVTTLAGGPTSISGLVDGTGAAARFSYPNDLTVDTTGNVYVADTFNQCVRKITPNGVVTTLAGPDSGNYIYGQNDGTGGAARFNNPIGISVDVYGNVYVADAFNATIRKITPTGVVTTLAGKAGIDGTSDGVGSDARFTSLQGIAVDNFGNVYVAESSNVIRKGILAVVSEPLITTSKALGDFDGNGKADLIWSNTATGERSMWFLNGNTMSGGASLGTVPVAWTVSATADFDGDGKGDIFWTNITTGDRAIWSMNGSTMLTNTFMGTIPTDWVISGTGDFNGDGKADLVWTNTTTGDRAMWLMNGSTVIGGGYLGTVPIAWIIGGVGDFNGDGKADLVWTNTTTGEQAMWFMNGSIQSGGATVGTIPVAWVITGVGDFNGDGKADIFLSNTTTGDRVIWLMNGSTIATNAFMGTIPVEWVVSGTGDFNGDGKKDVFWTNTATGDRAMWLLNGSTVTGGGFMGTVPVVWRINN